MRKTIPHNNILRPNPGLNIEGFNYTQIVCRGTFVERRQRTLQNFIASTCDRYNREIDNSYLIFEEDPQNQYDPNAIEVSCRGEFFGPIGYVAREHTAIVKEILGKCSYYRIDLVSRRADTTKDVKLLITWTDMEFEEE